MSKIEADLKQADWKANNHIPTYAVIDVMAKLRQMPFQDFFNYQSPQWSY